MGLTGWFEVDDAEVTTVDDDWLSFAAGDTFGVESGWVVGCTKTIRVAVAAVPEASVTT